MIEEQTRIQNMTRIKEGKITQPHTVQRITEKQGGLPSMTEKFGDFCSI